MIKKYLKKMLDEQTISHIKGTMRLIKKNMYVKHPSIDINSDMVKDFQTISDKKNHIFCGYYDYFPINNDKLLCQMVKKYSKTKKDDSIIGYYDLKENKLIEVTKTSAWCYQQGSRLHWSKIHKNAFFYNDVYNNSYCTYLYDINKGKIVKRIDRALYDISHNEELGASLNFSRLQRLRKGYGYDRLDDDSRKDNAPKKDGLFLVDIKKNESCLILSLNDLAQEVDGKHQYQHYINHICFSPEDDKIMFFHIWNYGAWPGWKTRLCVYDIDKKKLEVLESVDNVSHYDWMNNNEILITGCRLHTKENFYRIYNIKERKYRELKNQDLSIDGHPTVCDMGKYFISDTYPNNDFVQELFYYNFKRDQKKFIAKVFSDPRLSGEFRCDLHPKVEGNIIVVDSTFKKEKRSIIIFKLKDGDVK